MNGGRENEIESLENEAKRLESEAKTLERDAQQLEAKSERLEHEAEELEREAEELERNSPIQVVFNEKYAVTLRGRGQTGLSLKEAAIKENVPIHLDFVLSIELGGGKTKLIGDTDHIKVKEGDRFLAIPNDDNS